ncbi:MAG TPA: pentapeptide repeat-containing protein [Actinopolymorphaceae bacterium]
MTRLEWWRRHVDALAENTVVRGAALVLAGLILSVLVLWALPALLTRAPAVSGAEAHKAIADARTGLVAYVVALGALGTLAYTVRTYRLTRRGQLADRYTKAIEQLGAPASQIRVGGIFALAATARESEAYRQVVLEVLNAYIRERTRRTDETDRERPGPAHDIAVALRVMKSLQTGIKGPHLDFHGADLRGADLIGWSLVDADLRGTDLRDADLEYADLRGADLRGAVLTGARLYLADLRDARAYAGLLDDRQRTDVRHGPRFEPTDVTERPAEPSPAE